MQTLIQIFCKGINTSLRQKIATDKLLEEHGFFVEKHKDNSRAKGWLKLKSKAYNGSLNIEWNPDTKMLSTRIINKGSGKPDDVAGDFISYILKRHYKIVKCINILPID